MVGGAGLEPAPSCKVRPETLSSWFVNQTWTASCLASRDSRENRVAVTATRM